MFFIIAQRQIFKRVLSQLQIALILLLSVISRPLHSTSLHLCPAIHPLSLSLLPHPQCKPASPPCEPPFTRPEALQCWSSREVNSPPSPARPLSVPCVPPPIPAAADGPSKDTPGAALRDCTTPSVSSHLCTYLKNECRNSIMSSFLALVLSTFLEQPVS
jgi:hypothetical protein